VSVRLTTDEERVIRRLAKRQRSTVSHVIRTAVDHLVKSEEQKPPLPYDLIADLIGSVNDLDSDLSTKTGERFAEIVGAQAGKRK